MFTASPAGHAKAPSLKAFGRRLLQTGQTALVAATAGALELAPTQCRICRSWQQQVFCSACLAAFAPPIARCAQCALALTSHASAARDRPSLEPTSPATARMRSLCDRCRLKPSGLWQCIAAVDYAFPWNECVTAFKFAGDAGLARPLAELVRQAPGGQAAMDSVDLALPMPLSRQRLGERGYNQAHELARLLFPGRTSASMLLRIRHTGMQTERARADRWTNVRGAFAIEPRRRDRIAGRHVAMVDDVMTSGASISACRDVLMAAGAARVSAFVVARTPEPE